MTSEPILFTTIKIQDGILKAPLDHLDKLKRDYFTLNKNELDISIDDLSHFIDSHGELDGTWRLNVFASSPLRFKLTVERSPLIHIGSLKRYQAPFYERHAQFKKEDFSLRKRLLLQAVKEGVNDWIFTNEEGFFLETTICNIFWVKDQTLFTPSDELPLYMGVTLQNIFKAAKSIGLKVKQVKEKDIESLIESFVFMTNSMKEVLPIEKIDDRPISVDWRLIQALRWKMKRLESLQGAL